ncbi:nitrilase-related carbon-nitrogen hydrolase [Oxalobacter paraformigenes]|uniref:nitrilase-related carbon-nitrogen hydrolase n=1 Tax=Oxalobacter paraformigenes TaxID=556268 RepID=UPI0003189D1C|nr:nitrilase-related carbon-nitrogen hydrolase [Oxalobacter paraformigenes]
MKEYKINDDKCPEFNAAAVPAAPVVLNREATLDKVGTLLKEAVENGAKLVVFPESFIPLFLSGVLRRHL